MEAVPDIRAAEAALQKALRERPDDPALLAQLGVVLSRQLCWDGAAACLRRAVQLRPADADARRQFGQVLVRLGRLDQAESHLREVVRLRPADTAAGNDLAVALLQQAKLDDAAAAFDRVLAVEPDNAAAHSMRLYLLNYDHRVRPEELLEEHRRWARRFATITPADSASFPNDPSPDRRLRVGYVSPDFRRHPVGRLVESILAAHDPRRVEVICYDEAIRVPDDVTARLRARAHRWQVTRGLSHDRFAERVRADQVDILVDLAGHTADNRLAAFARRLAPVQVTYLGYPNTTGVPAMDYVLTDAVADPETAPVYFTETPVRLPTGFTCFAPRDDAPAVSPLPAKRNGYLTLGAPHTLGKLNAAVLDLWAKVLREVPTTHLVIARNTLGPGTRDHLRAQFAARGVADDRVELRQLTSGEGEYLGFYRDVDVTLDTFPWTGHTTACESLWMGVPVVTLRGTTHAGRMVASVLTHARLADWVADTPEQYVGVVKTWSGRVDQLAAVRTGLRDRVRRSPLCDAAGFARGLEDAYRTMWRAWAAGRKPVAKALPVPPGTPTDADGWKALGDAHKARGEFPAAAAAYRKAVELAPGLAAAHNGLGILSAMQRQFADAEGHFRRAVAAQPDHAKAHHNLGNVLSELGRYADAVAAYRDAERLGYRDAALYTGLGVAHLRQRQPAEAERVLRQAIATKPDDPVAHYHLGTALADLGRHPDAVAAFVRAEELGKRDAELYAALATALARVGRYSDAVRPASEAVRLKPNDPEPLKLLGFVLNKMTKLDAAAEAYRKAAELNPADADTHHKLGMVHTRQGFLDQAVVRNREAVRLQPGNPVFHSGLASAYIQNGDIGPALASIREAMRLNPGYAEANSSLLFMLCYDPDSKPEDVFEEHKAWARRFAPPPATPPVHANDRDPDRRLRVGYVSPDLRNHPVGFFIEPVLLAHDPAKIELVCYDECVWPPDQLAARLQKKAALWRVSRGMPDAEFARQIRDDRIDVLVDLAGHTASNRLRLFALKPAPVQGTYLGYPNTSGIPAIDYVLTDAVADPADAPVYFTETPVRLPGGFCCFAPRAGTPEVAPLPALRNGYVTFGSLHNQAKLNPAVLALWAEVLRAVPTARMLFVRHTLTEEARSALRQAFESRGVAADRVAFHQPPAGTGQYVKCYADIDVQLDPFPWTGHTTACESLWMGVPSITLRGTTHAGRMVASVLTFAGLPDWVADTPAEYVRLARSWAERIPELAALRTGMRARLAGSPLCDVTGFTRHLEDAYRTMWRTWCAND